MWAPSTASFAAPETTLHHTPLTRQQLTHNAPLFPQIVPLLSQLVPLIPGWGLGSLLKKDKTLKGKPFLSLTQINLKKKKNAWDTLIAFNKNMINPIILATEPYSMFQNKQYHPQNQSKPVCTLLFNCHIKT